MAENPEFSKRLLKALTIAMLVGIPALVALAVYNYSQSGKFDSTVVTALVLVVFCLLFVGFNTTIFKK